MEENIKKAFLSLKYEPEEKLSEDIWNKISLQNKRIIKLKLYSFSFLGIVSLSLSFPMFKMLLADFTKSGFYEYLSIAFSSNSSILYYWKELSYSLAESLPISSMIFSLALIFIFFVSFRYALKQIIKGQYYYKFS